MPNLLASYSFTDNYYNNLVDGAAVVKYVSASGSDSNNGNTVTTPYLTIAQALSATSGTATTVTIVILAGTYNISATSGGTGSYCINDGGNPRRFVCAPGQVIINCTDATGSRDFAPIYFGNASSTIYGAIIKRNNSGRTLTYGTAFFNDTTVLFKGSAYNTVFQETNANNIWTIQYDNDSNGGGKVYNCTFYNGANGSGDYSGGASLVITDSVFNTTYGSSSATFTGVLTSQTVNATTYVTTGVTTKGVYSGTYAWNGTTTFPVAGFDPATLSTIVSGNTINFNLFDSALSNVSYTITGVTTEDLNGTALTGYFTVVGSGNFSLSVPTKLKLAETKTLYITAETYTANVILTPTLGPIGLLTSANSLYWADSATITYVSDDVNGTNIAYTITGVSSPQINNAPLTGNFTISNGSSQLILQTKSTGAVQNTISISANNYTLNIPVNYLVSFTGPIGGRWGANLTYTAATRGLSNNELIPYAITGSNVTSSQLDNLPLTGTFTNRVHSYLGSTFFNGTSSFLEIDNSTTDFDLNGLAWTAECWIRPTGNYSAYRAIFCKRVSGSTTTSYEGYLKITTGVISFYNGTEYNSSYTLTANVWSHCAWVYTGSTLNIYVNGSLVYSVVVALGADNTEPFLIGNARGYSEYFPGNISNFRLVKGVAVYTGNFTPLTAPPATFQSASTNIAAITGAQTILLTCRNSTGNIIDYSTYSRTITSSGSAAANTLYPSVYTSDNPSNIGTGTLIVTTNISAPLLSTANGFVTVGSNTNSFFLKTTTAVVINTGSVSVSSIPINTITSDIHSQNVEAILSSNTPPALTVLYPITNQNTLTFINTITSDIHSQNVEGIITVSTNSFNSVVTSNTITPSISTIVPLPTYAYSSGTEISANGNAIAATPTVTQTWYI
jgi:hypothetical protein